jgi:putative transposase
MSNSCYENSITELFYHFEKRISASFNFFTRKEAKSSVIEYIEAFYNRIRAYSALDYHTPLEYEKNYEI